jgi:hypothetical protein
MSTNKDEVPDKREDKQQSRTRGGAADADVIKDMGTGQSDDPFEAPGKDADKPEEKA